MITHRSLGEHAFTRSRHLRQMIRQGTITMAGNRRLKIYGRLNCYSGKKMKMENRVFFKDAQEAIDLGYRPCGHCMPEAYQRWKTGEAKLRQR